MSEVRSRPRLVLCIAALLLLGIAPFAPAHAQADEAWVPGKGHGSYSIAYQDL